MPIKSLLFILPFLLFTACGGPNTFQDSKFNGKETVGDYSVVWGSFRNTKRPDGLTPLVFTFTYTNTNISSNVTEQDWQREAQRFGVSVATIKQILGKEAYKTPDGRLAGCTIVAIDKGDCGRKINLSTAQRTAIAQNILAKNSLCNWVGFDPAYHQKLAYQLGAESHMLHVRANCT